MQLKNSYSYQDVRFYSSLANAEDFPRPEISMLPELKLSQLVGRKKNKKKSFFVGSKLFFHEGRYALFHSLNAAEVKPGDTVLIPAYHCRSMVEPVIYLGLDIALYPVDELLNPDFDFLAQLCADGDVKVSALIIPHYFGFPQNMDRVKQLCDQYDICLIEDCAHAFYGSYKGEPLGSFGHFALSSPRKFLPVEDGGNFVDNRVSKAVYLPLVKMPIIKEIKAFLRCQLSLCRSLLPEKKLYNVVTLPVFSIKTEITSNAMEEFFSNSINIRGSIVSECLIAVAPHEKIISLRKLNYAQWLDCVNALEGCRALFSTLPENVVPYVFPLVIECDVENTFFRLKKLGMPLWRWEDFAVSSCLNSKSYRYSLIQLPCHQSLSTKQMDWMIDILKCVFCESEQR